MSEEGQPSLKELRSALARVILSPDELRLWLADAGVKPHRLDLSGPLEIQLSRALAFLRASGPAQEVAFYRTVRENYPGAALPELDGAISMLSGGAGEGEGEGEGGRGIEARPPQPSSRAAPQDRALILNLGPTELILPQALPDGAPLRVEEVVSIPPSPDSDLSTALRQVPIDLNAWGRLRSELDHGVERALAGLKGALHVFVQAPHAAAFDLGQTLELQRRTADVRLYQWDPQKRGYMSWPLVAAPGAGKQLSSIAAHRARGAGTVLSIELPRAAPEQSLIALADEVGCRTIIRLTPVGKGWIEDDVTAAEILGDILAAIDGLPRSEGILIATSLPVAAMVSLGKALSPTAFPLVGVCHWDASNARYVHVLDFVQSSALTSKVLPYPAPPGGWGLEGTPQGDADAAASMGSEKSPSPTAPPPAYGAEGVKEEGSASLKPATETPRPSRAGEPAAPPSSKASAPFKLSPSDRAGLLTELKALTDNERAELILLLDIGAEVGKGSPRSEANAILDYCARTAQRVDALKRTLQTVRHDERPAPERPDGHETSAHPPPGVETEDALSPNPVTAPLPSTDERAILELDRQEQWQALQEVVSRDNPYRLVFVQGSRCQGHEFFRLRIQNDLISAAYRGGAGEVLCPDWDMGVRTPRDYQQALYDALSPGGRALPDGEERLSLIATALKARLKREPLIILHGVIGLLHGDPHWDTLLWETIPSIAQAVGSTRHRLCWLQPVAWQRFSPWETGLAEGIQALGFHPRWVQERSQRRAARRLMRHPTKVHWRGKDREHEVGSLGRGDFDLSPTLPALWLSPLSPIQRSHVASYLRRGGFNEAEIARYVPELMSGSPNSQELIRLLREEWKVQPASRSRPAPPRST